MRKPPLPLEWIYPLVAITLIVGAVAVAHWDVTVMVLQAKPIDFVPFFISVGILLGILHLRRSNRKVRGFFTPGNVIFWYIVIVLLLYVAYLGVLP